MGGAHQRQECQKLDSSKHCCFQEASHRAVPNNQLLVRCVLDRLVIQLSNLTVASLRVPLLEATPSQPPPLRFTPWERSSRSRQSAGGGYFSTRRRAMRLRSIMSTVMEMPSRTMASPSSGMRPASSMKSPATVE